MPYVAHVARINITLAGGTVVRPRSGTFVPKNTGRVSAHFPSLFLAVSCPRELDECIETHGAVEKVQDADCNGEMCKYGKTIRNLNSSNRNQTGMHGWRLPVGPSGVSSRAWG